MNVVLHVVCASDASYREGELSDSGLGDSNPTFLLFDRQFLQFYWVFLEIKHNSGI